MKRLLKSSEEKSCLFVSDRKIFTHKLNISNHDTFVYKLIKQAKLFCIYCVNENVLIEKPFLFVCLFFTKMLVTNSKSHGC